MTVIDLTHTITGGMPVYPGTPQPVLSQDYTVEEHGFQETLLHFYSHTGTHMDAPAHMIAGGKSLDQYPAGQFVGSAVVVDCTGVPPGGAITMDCLQPVKALADEAEFLLFRTGWEDKWGDESYFSGYPCPDAGVMDYLCTNPKKGVGADTVSLDPTGASLPNHLGLLAQGDTVLIENLTNLGAVGNGLFTLAVLPLKYGGSDGAPVRAVALL